MTEIAEQLSRLARQEQSAADQVIEQTRQQYAELCDRADQPHEGDAALLRHVLDVLSLDVQRFEADAGLVRQAQRWARETSREVEAQLRASCKEAAAAARAVHASGRKPRVGERWHAESGILARLQNKVMHLEALRRELRRTWEQSDVVRRVIDEPPRK